ncbi:hypothetical protein CYL20_26590 [Pseudomonas palleroniana]|uniref:DUF1534 domain-containing protein n=1 Tax=Pseudomonas palleroniana TaxID=191390 RepID=A0A2L1JHL0_9PSED|nr:hypothetical protein CYL20_26590 [Pseudomonas palleroniana]
MALDKKAPVERPGHFFAWRLIVPTLRVGMPLVTLRVTPWDAERPGMHSHAERGNDRLGCDFPASECHATGFDRSHALRGNASSDALRHAVGRRAPRYAFPRGAWERSA